MWRRSPLADAAAELRYDKHNCVHFVAELAAAIGMTPDTRKLMKKPRSFLETLGVQNRAWLTSRNATIHRGGPKVVPRA